MARIRPYLALGIFLSVLGTAGAVGDKCTAVKLKAVGSAQSNLLTCEGKNAAGAYLYTCLSKALAKFPVAFAKAGTCAGDLAACQDVGGLCESSVTGALIDFFPSKCEAAKRKAAGKFAKAEITCYAKAALKGLSVDVVKCLPKAVAKFDAAIIKAGPCPDGGSPRALVESHCVQPAVTTDGGGLVNAVCPTTTTTTSTTSTSSTSTSTSTSTTTTSSSSTSSTICIPTTCAAEDKTCGSISDGCGGTLDCGTCASGASCGADNNCYAFVFLTIEDCSGTDVAGCTESAVPDASACTSAGAVTAVCWDGTTHSNGSCGGSAAWCTYKSTPAAECTGGARPGFVYACQRMP